MRNGLKIGFTVFFLLVTGWYLFPSIQNYVIQQRLESLSGADSTAYVQENYARIEEAEAQSLSLGLDLLGGMHVTLEVQVASLISELATDTDETFQEVLAAARQQAESGDESVIDAFVEEFESRDSQARLSRYFRNEAAGITRRSSNEEVVEYLRTQVDEAVDRGIEIIRDRVDRYGVTEPSIQKQGSRRIVVELPGVDDPERVRDLLRGTARLEFRLMANPQALRQSLQDIIQYYESAAPLQDTTAVDSAAADTAGTGQLLAGDEAAEDTSFDVNQLLDEGEQPQGQTGNPLLEVMQPVGQSVIFGAVAAEDTAEVNQLLSRPAVQEMLPRNIELMYTANEESTQGGEDRFFLLGVREEAELTGEVITDARVTFSQTNEAQVSMTMNSEGARTWARITGANVNEPVAVVLDNVVYSYPTIMGRIPGGRTQITGLASRQEAQDIVTVLKSGALPAPVEIIGERTVGPSLGEESIQAGLTSVIAGLILVALFMILYYQTGGAVADLALVINIIFILGILAAFKATLTLPGIAGIVLTIGMAVDANVLIFERVREEASTGKTLKAAVEGGYSKALSAIIDANITTFFVGAILYSFGVGPIQGFAVTLMAGILASLFSAIVITRIIFDYMIIDRRKKVGFG